MGVTITYTQISKNSFKILKNRILENINTDLEQYKIDDFYLENSFYGLKFVLMKGLGEKLDKIFGDGEIICSVDFESNEFKQLSMDKRFEVFESTVQESFLPPERIRELADLVREIDKNKIAKWYDHTELNENEIYPKIWIEGEEIDKVYNLRDIKECYSQWKKFISKVAEEETDYIIIR